MLSVYIYRFMWRLVRYIRVNMKGKSSYVRGDALMTCLRVLSAWSVWGKQNTSEDQDDGVQFLSRLSSVSMVISVLSPMFHRADGNCDVTALCTTDCYPSSSRTNWGESVAFIRDPPYVRTVRCTGNSGNIFVRKANLRRKLLTLSGTVM
jgi:hypothetical protein